MKPIPRMPALRTMVAALALLGATQAIAAPTYAFRVYARGVVAAPTNPAPDPSAPVPVAEADITVTPEASFWAIVGSTSPATLVTTVTNVGAAGTTLVFPQAPANYAYAPFAPGDCTYSSPLAANGGACSLRMTSSPTVAGNSSTGMTIAGSNGVVPFTIALATTGAEAALAKSSENAFSAVAGTSSAPTTVTTVRNAGTAPTTLVVPAAPASYAYAPYLAGDCASSVVLDVDGSCVLRMISTPPSAGTTSAPLTLSGSNGAKPLPVTLTTTATAPAPRPIGQYALTTPGTWSWVAPAGVTRVSVVAVGGGASCDTSGRNGGSGGGLGWKNDIAVVPGTSYTVRVGVGGVKPKSGAGQNGGVSYFSSAALVSGAGGTLSASSSEAAVGGSFTGDGGGAGGAGGLLKSTYGAGGGAGGYAGSGGAGGSGGGSAGPGSGQDAAPGSGGGGGGGSGSGSAPGGGVGLFGLGATGLGGAGGSGWTAVPGGGGSGGQVGGSGAAGLTVPGIHGGGGACAAEANASTGGAGAVRIIWGDNRAFPALNTADK